MQLLQDFEHMLAIQRASLRSDVENTMRRVIKDIKGERARQRLQGAGKAIISANREVRVLL